MSENDLPQSLDEIGEQETAQRRDEVIRRMLATPPRPKVAKVRPREGKESTGGDPVLSPSPAVAPP